MPKICSLIAGCRLNEYFFVQHRTAQKKLDITQKPTHVACRPGQSRIKRPAISLSKSVSLLKTLGGKHTFRCSYRISNFYFHFTKSCHFRCQSSRGNQSLLKEDIFLFVCFDRGLNKSISLRSTEHRNDTSALVFNGNAHAIVCCNLIIKEEQS